MDAGEQDGRNGLACLVEVFPECERFYRVSAKSGREEVVEEIPHGGVGVVCFERNFWSLDREPFPAVRLDGHDERRGDEHGDNPRGHSRVPVVFDFAEGDFMEYII